MRNFAFNIRFAGLRRTQGGADQSLGEHELAFVKVTQGQSDGALLFRLGVASRQCQYRVAPLAFERHDLAAKPLASALKSMSELNLGLMADGAAEIRDANQRTVDPWR